MLQRLLFLTLLLSIASIACGDDSDSNNSKENNSETPNNSTTNNPNASNNTQSTNNPQPTNNPTSTRNAQATVEISEGDFDQPLAFSTASPTGTYNSRSDDLFLLSLVFSTVSEDPEVTISLFFADSEKPVEPGEYEVVGTLEAGVYGSFSIGGEEFFGIGDHQTGSATLTSVEDGTVSGTKLVSGTFVLEGTIDWTNGKEGQSDFKILTGTFTDVPVTILP